MIEFHGLQLKNPLVVASCPATETVRNVSRCADQGCAAVILKSVAPDHMRRNTTFTPRRMFWQDRILYMLSSTRREFLSCEDGERLLSQSKQEVDIPIIASAAGSLDHAEEWLEALSRLASSGADLLQMDTFYAIPSNPDLLRHTIAQLAAFAVQAQQSCKKGILLKLSPDIPADTAYTALKGTNLGVSLLDSIRCGIPVNPTTGNPAFRGVSAPGRCRAAGKILYPLALLYTQRLGGIAAGRLCAGGGVFTIDDAVGLLASGATCIQIASAVCVYGFDIIGTLVSALHQRAELPLSAQPSWIPQATETTVLPGHVYSCHKEAPCGQPACIKTIMCDREDGECEACGLCIDVCPLGNAYFEEKRL